MHKVVFDSNVIISAILFGGKPLKTLSLAISGQIDAYISNQIQAEVLDKLLNKFHKDLSYALELFDILSNIEDVEVNGYKRYLRDEKDDFLLALADKISADYIITGDKDLLVLGKYKKVQMITPAEFLKSTNN